jgi:hypothetical protein
LSRVDHRSTHRVPSYRAIEGLSAYRRKETIIDAPRTHLVSGLIGAKALFGVLCKPSA